MKFLRLLLLLSIILISSELFAGVFNLKKEIASNEMVITVIIPDNHYIYSDSISFSDDSGKTISSYLSPAPLEIYDSFQEKTVEVYKSSPDFVFDLSKISQVKSIKIHLQGCSKDTCFLPESHVVEISQENAPKSSDNTFTGSRSDLKYLLRKFSIHSPITGYITADDFIKKIKNIRTGQTSGDENFSSYLKGKGSLMMILIIIAGGLALNLTPCVLPMIPINLAIIGAGARAASRLHGFLLGSIYAFGIIIAYGSLGIFSVLSGKTFGSLNASPWFNAGISIIFIILSLAMVDLITIDFSRFIKSEGNKNSNKLAGIFFMGLISALLAGACVAPVVIAVLLLSAELYATGEVLSLFLPFFLGLGMALPWPFAGAGLSFLPKPGNWMNTIKKIFAFLILLFAIFYGKQSYDLFKVKSYKTSGNDESGLFKNLDLKKCLNQSLDKQQHLLIDFWASWCKNCIALDKTTFKDKRVADLLKDTIKVKFDASNLKNEDIAQVLDNFSVKGLPTLIYLIPDKKEKEE